MVGTVDSEAEMRQVQGIRQTVFVEEQGIPLELERDGRDAEATHVLVRIGVAPVATGRLVDVAEGVGKIERIAVLRPFRGRGLGRRVVGRLEELAERAGLHTLQLEPHHFLEAFYESQGYRTISGTVTAGPHRLIRMEKTIRREEP